MSMERYGIQLYARVTSEDTLYHKYEKFEYGRMNNTNFDKGKQHYVFL